MVWPCDGGVIPARGKWLRMAITASTGSCYLLFGYDQPSLLNALGNPSSGYLGTIIGLYYIGCLLGCVVTGFVGKKFGRTGTIFCGSIIMVVGGIIQAAAFGPPMMIVGRIISGIGKVMNTATVLV
ncbi:hypothetical protein B0T11DRAFT_351597 [Plectosphaerella cucumerina]|uniref:Major facilitator superfamily (MFS) profile domain-containing protein n=1 Tax=Plectosphaerella cucumerina TaxID=40658 RepID=A0A8K0THV7_9PEZI|nr:hypothetical protein B0T11DRAFT_351597 [Plectosphaerella cucumerina]